MEEATRGEPVEEVLRFATEYAPDFSPVMFKKWRDAGLIPRPIRRPGRGKAQGKDSIYPDGTTAQLLRVLAMRSEPGRFNVNRALWRLWWDGWNIEPETIRELLGARQEEWETALSAYVEQWEALETSPDASSPFADGRLPFGTLGQARRRDRDHFEDIASLVLGIMAGKGASWFSDTAGTGEAIEDLRITAKTFGIDRVFHSLQGGERDDVASDIGETLDRFSDAMSPDTLREVVLKVRYDDMTAARDELKAFAIFAGIMLRMLEHIAGPKTAARDIFHDIQCDTGELMQGALLVWMSLRTRSGYRELGNYFTNTNELAMLASTIDTLTTGYKIPPRRRQPSGGSAQGDKSQCTTSLPLEQPLPDHETAS